MTNPKDMKNYLLTKLVVKDKITKLLAPSHNLLLQSSTNGKIILDDDVAGSGGGSSGGSGTGGNPPAAEDDDDEFGEFQTGQASEKSTVYKFLEYIKGKK